MMTDVSQRRFERWLKNYSEEEKFIGFILSNVLALHVEDIADLARQLGRDIPLFTVADAVERPIYAQYADGYTVYDTELRQLIREFTEDQYGDELLTRLLRAMERREESNVARLRETSDDWFYAVARRDFYRRDFTRSDALVGGYGRLAARWLDNLKTR